MEKKSMGIDGERGGPTVGEGEGVR